VPENRGFYFGVPSSPTDSAEELIRVLAPQFPEDNTPEKRDESRQALRDGIEEMKKGAGEIGKDWAKDIVKDHMTEVALGVGAALCTRGKKSNNRMLQWTGKAIRHVVHPFAKESEPSTVTQNAEHAEPSSIAHNAKHEEPPHQMTASAAAEASGCTVEQAETLLKYLGYRKDRSLAASHSGALKGSLGFPSNRVALIVGMAALIAGGVSYNEIANALNAQGIPVFISTRVSRAAFGDAGSPPSAPSRA
jgi:hypothetical protein